MALNRWIQSLSFCPGNDGLVPETMDFFPSQLVLSSLAASATTLFIPWSALQFPAPQAARSPENVPSSGQKCKYRIKTLFHDFLHCLLDFLPKMNIIEGERRCLQGFLHNIEQYGQEGTMMLWILLASLVGMIAWSVKEQFDRERDVECMQQLAREYPL